MTYLRVLDESQQTQDYCVQMDFQGAGVTVTRPFNNDYVVVTIPSAAAVSGWTDDGAIVRLTTVGDNVSIGSVDIIAGEKLRVVNPAGVAIRVEGREWFVKTGVADAAASQAASYVERFTASCWTGAAEAERDFDVYAGVIANVNEAAGFSSIARLAIDYEGFRLLTFVPSIAAPVAIPGLILFNGIAAGGAIPFDLRAVNDMGAGDAVFAIHDASPVDCSASTLLFRVMGDGALRIGANQVLTTQQGAIADVVDGVDAGADNTLRADVRAIKAMLRTHGLIAP